MFLGNIIFVLMIKIMVKFIELLKEHSKFISEPYHSSLSLGEEKMPHDLQPGNYAYWKRHQSKDCLQAR